MIDEENAYYCENARVYPKLAPFYDLITSPFGSLRRKVASFVDANARVLDVATGTGAQAFALAARGATVVGVDISEPMLRVARRKSRFPNVTFQRVDATDLPFEAETFDAACVSFALHEMPAKVRERVLLEMARVTKPGGKIIVTDYARPKNDLVRRAVQLYESAYYSEFVSSDLSQLFEAAGIELRWETFALGGAAKILIGLKRSA